MKVTPGMRSGVAQAAREEGLKRSDIIRLAVRDYLRNREAERAGPSRAKSNGRKNERGGNGSPAAPAFAPAPTTPMVH